jgi:hypothetical protein
MAKNKLRKKKIENDLFMEEDHHLHLTEFKHSKCAEKVVIYLEGYKDSTLQLLFQRRR